MSKLKQMLVWVWHYFFKPVLSIKCNVCGKWWYVGKCYYCNERIFSLDASRKEQRCSSCNKVLHKNGYWMCNGKTSIGRCKSLIMIKSFNLNAKWLILTIISILAFITFIRIDYYSDYVINSDCLSQYANYNELTIGLTQQTFESFFIVAIVFGLMISIPIFSFVYLMVKDEIKKSGARIVYVINTVLLVLFLMWCCSAWVDYNSRFKTKNFGSDTEKAKQYVAELMHEQAERHERNGWNLSAFNSYIIANDSISAHRVSEKMMAQDGWKGNFENHHIQQVLSERSDNYECYYKRWVNVLDLNQLEMHSWFVNVAKGEEDSLDLYLLERYKQELKSYIDSGEWAKDYVSWDKIRKANELGLLTKHNTDTILDSLDTWLNNPVQFAKNHKVYYSGYNGYYTLIKDINIYYLSMMKTAINKRFYNKEPDWAMLNMLYEPVKQAEQNYGQDVLNKTLQTWGWNICLLFINDTSNKSVYAFKNMLKKQGVYLHIPMF